MSSTIDTRTLLVSVLATGGLAVALAHGLAQVVGPSFVWGGIYCEPVGDVLSCAGYPPTGLVLAAAVAAAAVPIAIALVGRWRGGAT